MSSLLEFLQKERKLNWKFWFKYYHQALLEFIYSKRVKNDDSWKGIKIMKSYYPPLFPKKNINNNTITVYLELQNQNNFWKRK